METPPPEVSADGVITLHPPTGARTLNVRTLMFFGYTFITPAMIMRLTEVGSQYPGPRLVLSGRRIEPVGLMMWPRTASAAHRGRPRPQVLFRRAAVFAQRHQL